MPYCPTCKQEYVEGTTECVDCGSKLVAELPFQAVPGEGTTWVEIASTGTDDEARLIKGFLDAEGIPAQIENVKFTAEPVNFGTMGDIRVYVAAEDEARAQQLIKQRDTDFNRLEDDADTVITDEGTAEITEDEDVEVADAPAGGEVAAGLVLQHADDVDGLLGQRQVHLGLLPLAVALAQVHQRRGRQRHDERARSLRCPASTLWFPRIPHRDGASSLVR